VLFAPEFARVLAAHGVVVPLGMRLGGARRPIVRAETRLVGKAEEIGGGRRARRKPEPGSQRELHAQAMPQRRSADVPPRTNHMMILPLIPTAVRQFRP
jgi:hypothetical protein